MAETGFLSIQDLLRELCNCIVKKDDGLSYLRIDGNGGGGDTPTPDPEPFFEKIASESENMLPAYNRYLINANLTGICCGASEDAESASFTDLRENRVLTVEFPSDEVVSQGLSIADVDVKNESGSIYLQKADSLKWFRPTAPFTIKSGHLLAIRSGGSGTDYLDPRYTAPQILIGDRHLKDDGYGYLLGKLSSLIQNLKESTETIYYNLFAEMFQNSTRLTYSNVFYPYVIGENIYRRMFANCANLKTANLYISDKIVPTDRCTGFAEGIFDGCTALSVLELNLRASVIRPARMFKNAFNNTNITSLDISKVLSIQSLTTPADADYPLYNWLGGASNRRGTITKQYALSLEKDSDSGVPINWTENNIGEPPTPPEPEKPDLDKFDPAVPLCIENTTDVPAEIGMCNVYNSNDTPVTPEVPARGNCKISYDLVKWENYNFVLKPDTDINKTEDLGKITLKNRGDRVYIKADKLETAPNTDIFLSTIIKVINASEKPRIRVGGNIASWNKGSNDSYITDYLEMNSKDSYCYQYMFKDCDCLVQAPELPATRLAESCYYAMFSGCSNLTQSPALPATELAVSCYGRMFSGCTQLKDAPALPATVLKGGCYAYMFSGCRSLTRAPNLPATELAPVEAMTGCYSEMFSDCSKLTQAPHLPATTLTNFCYDQMFSGCSSLTKAPELPATALAENCYRRMFANCIGLNYIKCSATDTSATECTKDWLSGVASTGDFYTPAATNWQSGIDGIPSGWTRHDIT